MAREYASIRVKVWGDDDFRALPCDSQLLYFTLVTLPNLSYCGVTDWRPKKLAALAPDWTPRRVEDAARELWERLYVVLDEDTEEVLVRSFIRNDGLMKQPRMAVSMVAAYRAVGSRMLQGVIVHELQRLHDEFPDLNGWHKPEALELLSGRAIDPREVVETFKSLTLTGDDLGETENGYSFLLSPTPDSSHLAPITVDAENPKPSSDPAKAVSSAVPMVRPRSIDAEFDEFWIAYPRKEGKEAARRAFAKVTRGHLATPAELLAGARRYAADPNREPSFTAHPTTWLNQGRWSDEPLPARAGSAPKPSTTDSRVNAGLELAARLRQQENQQSRLEIAR